ncbi:MAG TPA: Rieske 2Fe-2S domain-containing protein [Egibacteraceae bacterium]|nr:Rieske 2Fe-2S domain-containing protein [Egibacteraceae bacterium]
MTTTLLLLATAAGLLALAFWWIRRNNLAVYPVGRAPRELRPLPTGCDLGERLMMATAADQAATTSTAGTASSGAGPTTAGPAALKRKKKRSGPNRRDFLRYGLLASFGGVLAAFGGASLAFLWPTLRGGFGAVIDAGPEDEVRQAIADGGGRFEFPSGRAYIVAYDEATDQEQNYAEITDGGFMALYQKCVHLGCRVPWCESSSWFECPCHGSRYNRWGEYEFGPAPRGLDRFAVRIEEGRVMVDTSTVVTGPSRGTNQLRQPPEGPHC